MKKVGNVQGLTQKLWSTLEGGGDGPRAVFIVRAARLVRDTDDDSHSQGSRPVQLIPEEAVDVQNCG